jgi:signal transduction histidine kinase
MIPSDAAPYAAHHLLALIFLIMGVLFLERRRRLGVGYAGWLSLGCLAAALGWGTTDWHQATSDHVSWSWWWGQPIFVFTMVFMAIGLLHYLPIDAATRRRRAQWIVAPSLAYLLAITGLMAADIPVLRGYALLGSIPAVLITGLVALSSEKHEPWMGHGLIGAALFAIPVVTALGLEAGYPTSVIRAWAGMPVTAIMFLVFTMASLKWRRQLEAEVATRRLAELKLQGVNQSLERQVQSSTVDLQAVISGLEGFNRKLSQDLRSPLGSIDVQAYMAEKFAQRGDVESAREQLAQIRQTTQGAHQEMERLLQAARERLTRSEAG